MTGALASLTSLTEALGLIISPRQAEALLDYLALLRRWNSTYNLTAVRDPGAMLIQHLADCLAIVPAVRRELPAGRLLDVGSGGGLPGVVLAIMLPTLAVTCVDAVGKKAAFIRQAAGTLGLSNLQAAHARVQTLRSGPFDLITCRAFACLADFTAWTAPLLALGGRWLAMKGKSPAAEVAALPTAVEVFHVEHLRIPQLDAERCLVWMRPAPTLDTPR